MAIRSAVAVVAIVCLLAGTPIVGVTADFDFLVLVDSATKIPDGTGTFTGFGGVVAARDKFAFIGFGAGGLQGIYTGGSEGIELVVSTADYVSAVGGRLTEFQDLAFDGDTLAFAANWVDTDGSNRAGVFTRLHNEIAIVADDRTVPPESTGNKTFTNIFTPISAENGRVAFHGRDQNTLTSGVYLYEDGALHLVANGTTVIPSSNQTFAQPGDSIEFDEDRLFFADNGNLNIRNGGNGIYVYEHGVIRPLVTSATPYPVPIPFPPPDSNITTFGGFQSIAARGDRLVFSDEFPITGVYSVRGTEVDLLVRAAAFAGFGDFVHVDPVSLGNTFLAFSGDPSPASGLVGGFYWYDFQSGALELVAANLLDTSTSGLSSASTTGHALVIKANVGGRPAIVRIFRR